VSQVKNLGVRQAVPSGAGQAAAEASVRQLIANGKCKTALENAKENHKALGTAASEALLVEAYAARIEALLQQNLAPEAQSLIELVRQRYPAARARLEGINARVAARSGALDGVLAPLADPQLSAERRAAIDHVVRGEVLDLAALASCPSLPAEHPLRCAAAALDRAFAAVTSGPVSNDVIALAEVSHRSPLAPWKLLVRAIASFYRHEDAVCREQLEAIAPDSAVAPLVPAIRAMLSGKNGGEALTASAAALVSQTMGDLAALRKALNDVDRLVDNAPDGAILRAVRTAVQECRKNAPEQLEPVKQHIFVRCAVEGMGREEVVSALGGPFREDASFFRLLARGLEQSGDPEEAALACGIWDEFRKAAVREGWFAANGREAAVLYLHMAGVLGRLPRELQRGLQEGVNRKNKGGTDDVYFVSAEELYRRACTLDPHPEAFSAWFKWASGNSQRQAENVAEAWHKICPTDIAPILHLMDGAAERKAFPTALNYLARAERIDGVHPAVRRARLRLLVGGLLRQIQQKKPHLAAEKLAEISALPEAQQGDRPAFVAALRALVGLAKGDSASVTAEGVELARLLGSHLAGHLLFFAVAYAAKRGDQVRLEECEKLRPDVRSALPAAIARVTALVRDMNAMNMQLPWTYLTEAAQQLPRAGASLDTVQLQTLAEAGVNATHVELAYAASAAGLERGGSTEARFLLLRARGLPEERYDRRVACAAAALEIARQRREEQVVHLAVEFLHGPLQADSVSVTLDEAGEILRGEKAEPKVFAAQRRDPGYERILKEKRCDCPKCRRERGEIDEESEDFEDIFNDMPLPPDMPPEIARMFFEETRKAVESGESLDSLLARLFVGIPPGSSHKRGSHRKGKPRP
jgi:HPt (histidine-containing phosphotransfer) domain-containing protein